MFVFTNKRRVVVLVGFALIVALLAVPSLAGEKHKVSGKMTMDYPEQERIEVGDTKDHALTFGTANGTNECTGEHAFMDGAQVVNMAFGDLVQGSGSHQGYVKLSLGDDAVFCKWEGAVITTVPEEGAPIMSFEGTYSYIKGTGQYENIQGRGTYKGAFTSKTQYVAEWEGEYFIAEMSE